MIEVEFDQISMRYGSRPVLEDISFQVSEGSKNVFFGPSGCGKTTILRLVAGFITPDKGVLKINGTVAAKDGKNFLESEERGVGFVFQDLALWPHMTVRENLEFGLKIKSIPQQQRNQRICEILTMLRLEDKGNARPHQLSMGQQQRVAIGRALVSGPKILLMDEPFSSLDLELRLSISNDILQLQKRMGFTLILVTHQLEEALDLAETVLILEEGAIAKIGTKQEIKNYMDQLSMELRSKYQRDVL